MEGKGKSKMEIHPADEIGNSLFECSFVSGNVECLRLGSFRVPKPFHKQFGRKLPSRLKIKCRSNIWIAKYDHELNCIYGLRTFVKFYGVRIFGLVQFDYYGNGLFRVNIFKETAIECQYPLSDPRQYKKSEAAKEYNIDEFVINLDSLEYFKRIEQLLFNGIFLEPHYAQIDIMSRDIDPRNTVLVLNRNLKSFYKYWEHGSKVVLKIAKKTWEVEIQWKVGNCMFEKGWQEFAIDTELAVGDSLVLYKFTNDDQLLNATIFKGNEYVFDKAEGSKSFPRSFYKLVTPVSLDAGFIIVPKLVKDNYSEKLSQIKVLEVCGVQKPVFYNPSNGCLKGLKQMTDFFYLRQKETVFFTMEQDSNILTTRVYEEDGMEIDYLTRPLGLPNNSDYVWIWDIDLPFVYESEDAEEEEVQDGEPLVNENVVNANEGNNNIHEFTTTLSKCHVHNRTQGVSIPRFIVPANRQWIVGERVLLRTEEGSWSVGLTVNDGRARFSAGWNKFARDNELKRRQNLVFNMIEGAEGIVFEITKLGT